LFATGDIVTIINIGTGTCTITAGTATVTTSGSLVLAQNQGGVLRFTSPSEAIFLQFATPASGDIEGVTAGTGISGGGTSGTVTITNSMATAIDAKGDLIVGTGADAFSRLAVGATNGHVLTVDSAEATGLKYAAAGGGGTSWTLLNTGGTALTGASTITISGISNKDKIMIMIPLASSVNTGENFKIRLNTDSGSNYTYHGTRMYATTSYAAGNFAGYRNVNDDGFFLGRSQDGATAYAYMAGGMIINAAASSGIKSVQYTGGGVNIGGNGQEAVNYTGFYNSASTISSVSIVAASGNFDDGSIFVYTSS
jgi:hypothetical protein